MLRVKKAIRSVIYNTPVLLKLFIKRRFSIERDLIKGVHQNHNQHPSIIHFSLNKAATQFTKQILRKVAWENGMTPVKINGYAFFTEFPYLTSLSAEEMSEYQHIFKPEGYLYSAFGGFVSGIPELERYKIILMVRDPRDVLVSWYYSVAYSHSIPPKTSNRRDEYLEEREKAREMTIDEHVISQSERVFTILNTYKNKLYDPYPNVYLTSYEEMTTDFQEWLRNLLNASDLKISDRLFDRFVAMNDAVQPEAEDKTKHIRKGKPGDFRNKLDPDTITYLNEKFAPILDAFQDVLKPE